MVVGKLLSLVGRLGRGFLRRGARLGSFARKFKTYKYSTLGGKAPLLNRGVKAATKAASKAKEGIRRGIKGAWRKFQLDPAGTAISAYSATRTPSLRLEFGSDLEAKLSGQSHNIAPSSYSSW